MQWSTCIFTTVHHFDELPSRCHGSSDFLIRSETGMEGYPGIAWRGANELSINPFGGRSKTGVSSHGADAGFGLSDADLRLYAHGSQLTCGGAGKLAIDRDAHA